MNSRLRLSNLVRALGWTVLWLLGLQPLAAVAAALDGAKVYNERKAAVVRIEVTGRLADGRRLQSPQLGSGFVVHGSGPHTVIVTAAHILKPRTDWYQENGAPTRSVRVQALDAGGRLVTMTDKARVHEQNDEQDWAILLVDGETSACVEPGDATSVRPGDSGALIGYESGQVQPGYSPGKVTRTSVEKYGFVLRLGMTVVEGQSGGPILDADGRVIGIASANQRDRLGYHIGVPIGLLETALRPIVPVDSSSCVSAERRFENAKRAAEDLVRRGRLNEYVRAVDMILADRNMLPKMADAKRISEEVSLRVDVALRVAGPDYIEGLDTPHRVAIAHLEKARLLNPHNPVVLILLGFVRAEDIGERTSPDARLSLKGVRDLFERAGNQIEEDAKNGISDPDRTRALRVLRRYWQGRALLQIGDYAAAETELKEGLGLLRGAPSGGVTGGNPEDFLYRLGTVEFFRSNDIKKAFEYWSQMSSSKRLADALTLTGIRLWADGVGLQNAGKESGAATKFVDAEKALATARQLGASSFLLSQTLGVLHFSRRNYSDAASNFKDAFDINPGHWLGAYWLGRANFMIEEPSSQQRARVALQRAITLRPEDSNAHYWYGRTLFKAKEWAAAEPEFRRALELDPDNSKAVSYAIWSALAQDEEKARGRPDRVAAYERALRRANEGAIAVSRSTRSDVKGDLEPVRAYLWNALAFEYAEEGSNLEIADSYADRALAHDPSKPGYMDTKAWVLVRMAELSSSQSVQQRDELLRTAEGLLLSAKDAYPVVDSDQKAESLYHLGRVEQLRGRAQQARGYFRQALETDPGHKGAQRALSQ